jgi:hypothetical protein
MHQALREFKAERFDRGWADFAIAAYGYDG